MKIISAVLIGMLATSVWAKDRIWQDGSLLDTRSNKYFPRTEPTAENDKSLSSRMFADPQSVSTSLTVYDHYVVESANAAYLVERGRFKSAKALVLRPNQPVKFAVEKKKLWLLDEEGKQQEAVILMQVERDVARPSVTAGLPAR